MALVDLLTRQTVALLHQVDEAEVARAENNDVAVRDVVLRELPLLGAAGGLPKCVAYAAVVLVPVGHSGHRGAALEGALDELVEAVAVALLEGRALRLAVVGEDDELVRSRRVGPGALDAGELLVELAQRLE